MQSLFTTLFTLSLATLIALFSPGCATDDSVCPGGFCDSPPSGGSEPVVDTSTCISPTPGTLVLNELLADPSGVDINGDQVPSARDDEFVELLNRTLFPLDLTGVSIRVGDWIAHTFDARCVEPGKALVLFGGGDPRLDIDALVSDSPLRLTNTGTTIGLLSFDGDLLDSVTYGKEADAPHSLTRDPDGTGTWQVHGVLADSQAVVHSAGRCVNGSTFPECAPLPGRRLEGDGDRGDDVDRVDALACPVADPGEVVINEVMADPGGFDTNADGTVMWREDEFVELILTAESERSLGAITLVVNGVGRSGFDAECHTPGTAIVVFGGGTPALESDPLTHTMVADKALGLTNDGATLKLQRDDGATIAGLTYGAEAAHDESLTRFPDATGPFVRHGDTPMGTPASPGRCTTGAPLWTGCHQDAVP